MNSRALRTEFSKLWINFRLGGITIFSLQLSRPSRNYLSSSVAAISSDTRNTNLMMITHRYGGKKAMNNGRWQPHEDKFVRDNANKMTPEQMSEVLKRSPLAIHLYMHRKHIVVGQTVKRNLVQEMLRIKFRHPENFMPTRAFYREVGINQMRWWDLFHGRKNINQQEYLALSNYFGITLEEAFAARQLYIFEEESND